MGISIYTLQSTSFTGLLNVTSLTADTMGNGKAQESRIEDYFLTDYALSDTPLATDPIANSTELYDLDQPANEAPQELHFLTGWKKRLQVAYVGYL